MIRGFLAVVFFAASLYFNALAWVSLVTALLALVMIATALTRKCPLYTVAGVNTTHTAHPSR